MVQRRPFYVALPAVCGSSLCQLVASPSQERYAWAEQNRVEQVAPGCMPCYHNKHAGLHCEEGLRMRRDTCYQAGALADQITAT